MTKRIPTCDICDDHRDLVTPLPPIFSDYGGRPFFHGPVRTVKCFEDNSKVKAMLKTPGEGAVLVVDGGASVRRALVGGNVAASAAENGWAGVIVYGAVRDRLELADVDVGLRALALYPIPTLKRDVGEMDIPIDIENVRITPGDYVYADEDGIVFGPRALHKS